jgi:tetratricopeptide (TPR) repeat protein
MALSAERFAVITDRKKMADPNFWIISAEADTLQAASQLTRPTSPEARIPRAQFEFEFVKRTLVFETVDGTTRPEPAGIYRALATPAVEGGGAQTEEVPPHDPLSGEMIDRYWLKRVGVAPSDMDPYARLNGLGFLGMQSMMSGDFDGAERAFSEAVDLARKVDHPGSEVKALGSRGEARLQLGRIAEAIQDLEAALRIARRDVLVQEEGPTLTKLAEALVRAGRMPEAQKTFAERTKLALASGDPVALAIARANEGITYCEAGQPAAAREALEAAVGIFGRLGLQAELLRTLAYLGLAQQADGDAKACMRTYSEHLKRCAAARDFSTAGSTYINMAQILVRSGRRAEGHKLVKQGLKTVNDPTVRRILAEAEAELSRR